MLTVLAKNRRVVWFKVAQLLDQFFSFVKIAMGRYRFLNEVVDICPANL